MECSCNIEGAHDGDVAELYTSKTVTARKAHVCYECYREIVSGERYETASGLTDGEFFTHKTCIDCLSVRGLFKSWELESLWEHFKYYIEECGGDIPEVCLAELTPMARAKTCEIIEGVWAHGPEGE